MAVAFGYALNGEPSAPGARKKAFLTRRARRKLNAQPEVLAEACKPCFGGDTKTAYEPLREFYARKK
jgi:hypothetical protein